MMNDRRNVCFCQTGHPVFYVGSMQPPNCRTCGAHINLAKGSMPVAEAQRRGLLDPPKQEQPAEPAAQPESPAAQPAAQPAVPAQPTPVPQGPAFQRPAPAQAPGYAPAPPPGPAYSAPQSAPAAPAYASAPPRPTPVAGYGQPPQAPAYGQAPQSAPPRPTPVTGYGQAPQAAPAPGYGQAPQATPPRSMFFGQQFGAAPAPGPANQQSGYQLDFFGEKIDIPQEGGWIGRSELGSQWLEGNLLISRRHVHVRPTPDGMLSVGPDSSLNGVSYDDGTGKRALQPSETVLLPPGGVLWLYNIPLKLERKGT